MTKNSARKPTITSVDNVFPNIPPSRQMSKVELAEFLGCALPTIDAFVRRGCPVLLVGDQKTAWVFDAKAIVEWRVFDAPKTANWVAPEPEKAAVDPDTLSPRDQVDHYNAQLKKRQLEKEDRELIPATEFEDALSEVAKSVVQCLDTIPDVLERDTGLSAGQVARVIRSIDVLRDGIHEKVQGCLDTLRAPAISTER